MERRQFLKSVCVAAGAAVIGASGVLAPAPTQAVAQTLFTGQRARFFIDGVQFGFAESVSAVMSFEPMEVVDFDIEVESKQSFSPINLKVTRYDL